MVLLPSAPSCLHPVGAHFPLAHWMPPVSWIGTCINGLDEIKTYSAIHEYELPLIMAARAKQIAPQHSYGGAAVAIVPQNDFPAAPAMPAGGVDGLGPEYRPFLMMMKAGVPQGAVDMKCQMAGLDPARLVGGGGGGGGGGGERGGGGGGGSIVAKVRKPCEKLQDSERQVSLRKLGLRWSCADVKLKLTVDRDVLVLTCAKRCFGQH